MGIITGMTIPCIMHTKRGCAYTWEHLLHGSTFYMAKTGRFYFCFLFCFGFSVKREGRRGERRRRWGQQRKRGTGERGRRMPTAGGGGGGCPFGLLVGLLVDEGVKSCVTPPGD